MTATITKDSLFIGEHRKSIQKIRDNGYNNILNTTPVTLEILKVKDLDSLETQRETNSKWVEDRLKYLGGLDMFAFGAISVALTPEGKYLVYDGLGRYNQAIIVGLEEIPCLVTKMTAKQASFYFAYNQSKGRRSMSPEALFVNNYVAGDYESQILAHIMSKAGLYVQGNTQYPVPHPKSKDAVEVKFRTINDAVTMYARGPMGELSDNNRLCEQLLEITTKLLVGAFNEKHLQQDLFWATSQIVNSCMQEDHARKESVDNPGYKTLAKFKEYLDAQAGNYNQKTFVSQWKILNKGTTGNIGKIKELTDELVTHWQSTKFAPVKWPFKRPSGLNFKQIDYLKSA
tara:strand:+ start:363 stop:1394 length:1032 start_codon:yes stop_codon:yes gene_type:complete